MARSPMSTRELTLPVTGMHCGACVNRLTLALKRVPGVTVEKVEVGSAQLRYEPEVVTPEVIRQAVEKTGFGIGSE